MRNEVVILLRYSSFKTKWTLFINTLELRAQAFDYLFDAVVVTDLDGIIRDWNKGSENIYGYTATEAIGQPVQILHVPDDIEHLATEVLTAVEHNGQWIGEVRALHKDGSVRWVEAVSIPVRSSDQSVIGALGIIRDITDRVIEKERLNYLAHYDQLTKIPNRYLLLDRIAHLIAQSKRNETSFALLYIDLDRFKSINDGNGHAFGDQVLVESAVRIKKIIRESDTVARVGGDEFVILLENMSDLQRISEIAETLITELSKDFIVDNRRLEFSCSIGIAIYPDAGDTTDALLAAADKAMYRAKHKGRGIYEF